MLSLQEAGKTRRIRRIIPPSSGKTLIVPVDDSLIFGPTGGLEALHQKIPRILADPPNALLAFPGLFRSEIMRDDVAVIVNLTASTHRSRHTRKALVGTLEMAVQLSADAVAVHVNITSKYEREMLRNLGSIACSCDSFGIPLLAIMYPRRETTDGNDDNFDELKKNDRRSYADLVSHSARVGVDLGANIIKTKYTGDPESFASVVNACTPVPVVIAGGPALPILDMLRMAHDAIIAGAAGISFGRNVFSREDPQPYVAALKAIVHEGLNPEQAMLKSGLVAYTQ